jgi:hypothetical protein
MSVFRSMGLVPEHSASRPITVFQVIKVVGPGEVLAISGNDHGAVRTRMRSTEGVLGWRDVGEEVVATTSPTLKHEAIVRTYPNITSAKA